jgi:peptide-methionine (S)-S-oxide reductase
MFDQKTKMPSAADALKGRADRMPVPPGHHVVDETQRAAAERTRDEYQRALTSAGHGTITTEIQPAPEFYFAEDYRQQYLSKNPDGYCGLGGTGVSCPAGVAVA